MFTFSFSKIHSQTFYLTLPLTFTHSHPSNSRYLNQLFTQFHFHSPTLTLCNCSTHMKRMYKAHSYIGSFCTHTHTLTLIFQPSSTGVTFTVPEGADAGAACSSTTWVTASHTQIRTHKSPLCAKPPSLWLIPAHHRENVNTRIHDECRLCVDFTCKCCYK